MRNCLKIHWFKCIIQKHQIMHQLWVAKLGMDETQIYTRICYHMVMRYFYKLNLVEEPALIVSLWHWCSEWTPMHDEYSCYEVWTTESTNPIHYQQCFLFKFWKWIEEEGKRKRKWVTKMKCPATWISSKVVVCMRAPHYLSMRCFRTSWIWVRPLGQGIVCGLGILNLPSASNLEVANAMPLFDVIVHMLFTISDEYYYISFFPRLWIWIEWLWQTGDRCLWFQMIPAFA